VIGKTREIYIKFYHLELHCKKWIGLEFNSIYLFHDPPPPHPTCPFQPYSQAGVEAVFNWNSPQFFLFPLYKTGPIPHVSSRYLFSLLVFLLVFWIHFYCQYGSGSSRLGQCGSESESRSRVLMTKNLKKVTVEIFFIYKNVI
jgi:hypothetical protein